MSRPASPRQQGFTLIELVIGIALTGSVIAMLVALIYPQFLRSVDPLLSQRASALGQALAEEILARPYDELSPIGGVPPCNPCSVTLGPDAGEASRPDFDDVDDFDFYCGNPGDRFPVENALGVVPADLASFAMRICVDYDGDFDGLADGDESAKLIAIDVWPSAAGTAVHFDVYRANF